MVLFKKRITEALIRQRGCAGWSAPVLFTTPQDRFSRIEAHLLCCSLEICFLGELTIHLGPWVNPKGGQSHVVIGFLRNIGTDPLESRSAQFTPIYQST